MKNIGCGICGGHDLPHVHEQLVRIEGEPGDVCSECLLPMDDGPHTHLMAVLFNAPSWQGTITIPEDNQ